MGAFVLLVYLLGFLMLLTGAIHHSFKLFDSSMFDGKSFFSNGGHYIIVADAAGGYCRIQDLNDRSSNPYVTQDFKSYNDLPVDDRERLTHYKIKKRGEK